MKTIDEIIESGRRPDEVITELKMKTVIVPSWSKLKKSMTRSYTR